MKIYLYILTFFMVFFIQKIKAQDPVYSQFYYNRLELNPAFAGNDGGGKFRINSFHRNLYRPIKGPFNSTNFSLDYGLCTANIGVGLIASNENQGDGYLQTNKIEGVLSVGPMRLGRNVVFSGGFKFGYIFQNLDWSKYTFSDQYDPIFGNVRPSVNSTIVSDFSNAPLLGLGINFSGWNWKKTRAWNAGCSGNNLLSPKLGYLSPYNLPMRLTLYGALIIHKNPAINANSGRLYSRLDYQDFTGTKFITNVFLGEYYFNNALNLGLGLRTTFSKSTINSINALIISAGLQPASTLKIIASYEINISGTANGNTFELGIVWVPQQEICALNSFFNMFRSRKKGGGNVNRLTCPVFGKDVIKPF